MPRLRFRSVGRVAALLCCVAGNPVMAQKAAPASGIGSVKLLQGAATLERGGKAEALVMGASVQRLDRLTTTVGARVPLEFADGSQLALGEKAELVIDEYLYSAKSSLVLLDMAKGAFRFATGQIGKVSDKRIEVRLPAATLAVRGTEFWGGEIDGGIGVLVLAGRIEVRNPHGSVVLDRKGQGTMILGPGKAPERPVIWGRDKLERALASTALGSAARK